MSCLIMWTLQWIFGMGMHERLGGTRTLALSSPRSGISRLGLGGLVLPRSLLTPRARGLASTPWSRDGLTAWGSELKQVRPLEGGGSCLVLWLASSAEEPDRRREPLVPPWGRAGMDTRLWRRGGCRIRGQPGPCGEARCPPSGLDRAPGVGLLASASPWVGLGVVPGPSLTWMLSWVLSSTLNSSGSGTGGVSTPMAGLPAGGSESVQWDPSPLVLLPLWGSLWPSVWAVFTSLSWVRCSWWLGLEGCICGYGWKTKINTLLSIHWECWDINILCASHMNFCQIEWNIHFCSIHSIYAVPDTALPLVEGS